MSVWTVDCRDRVKAFGLEQGLVLLPRRCHFPRIQHAAGRSNRGRNEMYHLYIGNNKLRGNNIKKKTSMKNNNNKTETIHSEKKRTKNSHLASLDTHDTLNNHNEKWLHCQDCYCSSYC